MNDDDDGSGIPPVQIPLVALGTPGKDHPPKRKASLPSSRATRGRRNDKTTRGFVARERSSRKRYLLDVREKKNVFWGEFDIFLSF